MFFSKNKKNMPFNQIKVYNSMLELDSLDVKERQQSLFSVFTRDFIECAQPSLFRGKAITPTPVDGVATMGTLFNHLTTKKEDPNVAGRRYDRSRCMRLHWIRYHLDDNKVENMLYFTVKEPQGYRTYIYDRDEKYVIVLEPLRDRKSYYLLTAYNLEGKDSKRNKIERKYKRRLQEIL